MVFWMGPEQLVSPNVLNKNGRATWWNSVTGSNFYNIPNVNYDIINEILCCLCFETIQTLGISLLSTINGKQSIFEVIGLYVSLPVITFV